MDIRYQNGKIYKITDVGYNMCYIGSTIQPLSKRFGHHRDTHHTGACASSVIFKSYGRDNCKITLIENYPCNNKEQLKAREGHFIETMDCVNKFIAGGDKSVWDKRYYQKNRDAILEKSRMYQENHREEIKEQQQQYRDTHREQKRETDRQYRENNKETINAKKLELILCECGCYSVRSSIARHKKTKKHIELMKLKEPEENTNP